MASLDDRLAAAKLWLISPSTSNSLDSPCDLPYLAHAIYALATVPTTDVATMVADEHWRLYVNPVWADETPVPDIGRELAHLIWHLLMDHATRARDMAVNATTARQWHQACDLVVNDTLKSVGACPDHIVDESATIRRKHPGARRPGRPAEEYYTTLSQLPATPPPGTGGSPSGSSSSKPPGQGSGSTAASNTNKAASTGSANGGKVSSPGSTNAGKASASSSANGGGGDPSRSASGAGQGENNYADECGSACDGIQRPWELPRDADVGTLDQADADLIRTQVAIDYQAHMKGRGDEPGEALRWAKHLTDPVIPWEPLLARAVRYAVGWATGREEPTWSKPSRRQSATPAFLQPGWRRPIPSIAMVVDTSGSIDDFLLGTAMSEVEGALKALGVPGANVTVYACDASVGAVSRIRKAADATLVGGGGTDMRVGIAAASQARPRPDLIVVFTDGYTPWPNTPPPGSAVIAAMLRREDETVPPPPPWTTRIDCVLR